jgi:hypothetical protein
VNFREFLQKIEALLNRSRCVAFPLLVIELVEIVTVLSDVFQVCRQLEQFLVFVAVLMTLAEGFDSETWERDEKV